MVEIYARWLDGATKAGFMLSLAAFVAYVSGALPAYVPPAALPQLWGLSAARFAEATGAPQGWGWLALVGYGYYLCLAAAVLFAAVTLVCYLRLLPMLIRERAWLDALLALAQVVVLATAASGVVAGAG